MPSKKEIAEKETLVHRIYSYNMLEGFLSCGSEDL